MHGARGSRGLGVGGAVTGRTGRPVGRSESWMSQVERSKRGVDSHAVLIRMAAVLRVKVKELTGPDHGDGEEAA